MQELLQVGPDNGCTFLRGAVTVVFGTVCIESSRDAKCQGCNSINVIYSETRECTLIQTAVGTPLARSNSAFLLDLNPKNYEGRGRATASH